MVNHDSWESTIIPAELYERVKIFVSQYPDKFNSILDFVEKSLTYSLESRGKPKRTKGSKGLF